MLSVTLNVIASALGDVTSGAMPSRRCETLALIFTIHSVLFGKFVFENCMDVQ